MRKLLIATVLFVLLLGGVYIALPAIAEYSVRQVLKEQQISASFVLQHPSFNHIEIHQLKLEKDTAEQSFTLTTDTLSLRFSPWQLFDTGGIKTLAIDNLKIDLRLRSQSNTADETISQFPLSFTPLPSYILDLIPIDNINLSHYRATIITGTDTNNLSQFTFSGSANATKKQLSVTVDQLDQAPDIHTELTLNDRDEARLSVYVNDKLALQTETSLSYQQQQLQSQNKTILYPAQLRRLLQQPIIKTLIDLPNLATLPSISGDVRLSGHSQIPLGNGILNLAAADHQYQLDHQVSITQLPGIAQLDLQQVSNLTLTGDELTLTISKLSANGQQLHIHPQTQNGATQVSTAAVQIDLLAPLTFTSTLEQLNQSGLEAIQLPDTRLQISLQPINLQLAGQPEISIQSKPLKLALSQIDLSQNRLQADLTGSEIKGSYGIQALPQISLNAHANLSPTQVTNRFSLQLKDPLLTTDVQISGSTSTTPNTGHTTGNWRTTIPLTGIETLIRRFTTALPPELVFTRGTLKQQGWLDSNKTGIALRLLNQTTQASLSYDQTHLYDINWNSETIKNHQGKLEDTGQLKIAFIDIGVPLEHFSGGYHFEQSLNDQPLIHLDINTVDLLGGTVTTLPVTIPLDDLSFSSAIAVTGVDLGQLIALEQQEGLSGTGTLNGQMPIDVSNGALSIVGGQVISTSEGGWIRFEPPLELQALTKTNQALAIAFDVLRDMHYERLDIKFDYQPGGEALLKTHLKGHNPSWNNGRPVDFTINIEENIPQLIQALQFTDKLTKSIEKRYR